MFSAASRLFSTTCASDFTTPFSASKAPFSRFSRVRFFSGSAWGAGTVGFSSVWPSSLNRAGFRSARTRSRSWALVRRRASLRLSGESCCSSSALLSLGLACGAAAVAALALSAGPPAYCVFAKDGIGAGGGTRVSRMAGCGSMADARDCSLLGAIGVCCTRDSPLWAPGARGFGAGIPRASAWAMVSARGAVCVLVICACVGTGTAAMGLAVATARGIACCPIWLNTPLLTG